MDEPCKEVGLTTGAEPWAAAHPLLTLPAGLSERKGVGAAPRPQTTALFLLPAAGKDAETFAFMFEWKYLSVQIITLQLIMQSKQYTRDLNIMTAWKFTVFELNMQQVLPNVCWKVAQN